MKNEPASFSEIVDKDPKALLRERAYKNFVAEWQANYIHANEIDKTKLIADLKHLENMGFNKNVVTMLFDHKQFNPLYFSDNFCKIMGYTRTSIERWGGKGIFRIVHWQHINLMLQMHLQGNKFIQRVPLKWKTINPKNFLCGLKVVCKDGTVKNCFLNITRLSFDENNQPALSIAHIEDITPLLKGNLFWIRFVRGNQNEYTRLYRSQGAKKEFKDLISKRELELLKLIAEGKESKEISKLLHISLNTVENHRKNMIARSGARDMTALLQICRMAEIL